MTQQTTAEFTALDWQLAPWDDKSLTVLLTGSAGGGKSRLAAEKMHGFLKKYPGATGLMLRKAKEYAGKSIVPFMEHTVIGDDSGVKKRKMDTAFYYTNGSVLYWGGMKDESQREGLRSIGKDGSVDIIWVEEAHQFTEDDYNELLARLRGTHADWLQIILTTNPDTPTHWIYQRLIKGGQAQVYYSGAQDNPYNASVYINILDKLTGVLYQRLALGKWVQAEGAVYPDFDPQVHLIDKLPEIKRWMVGIDFGYTNPFVCTLWGLDTDDRLYLCKQIYMSKRIVEDHVPAIKTMTKDLTIERWITDHDAEDRATLERHLGIGTTTANKAVTTGIQAVQQRLAIQEDGKPRLFILRDAVVELDATLEDAKRPTSTQDEITGYAWVKSKDGKPVKEEPVKVNDHGMDEMRYIVMELENPTPVGADLIAFVENY